MAHVVFHSGTGVALEPAEMGVADKHYGHYEILLFGGGSMFTAGEDTMFIRDCI